MWSKYKSVHYRLTFWYTLVLIIIILAFSALVYFSLRHTLIKNLDTSIQSEAEWTANLIDLLGDESDDLEEFVEDLRDSLEDLITEYSTGKWKNIQVWRSAGEVIYKSKHLDHIFSASENALERALDEKHTIETIIDPIEGSIRLVTMPAEGYKDEIYIVQVGVSFREIQQLLRQLLLILISSGIIALIASVLGGWFLARKSLKPVDEITKTAQRIGAENLSQRLEVPSTDDELSRLASTLNKMMDRLELSFRQIRQFTSDASHELRTPLTAIRGQTEVALRRDRNAEEYRQVLKSNLEEVEWMSRIVENLLTLSRNDAGEFQLDIQPIYLAELLRNFFGECKSLAETKGIEVFLDKLQDIIIPGDETWLRQMLLNIIDNAVKYTPNEGQIRLSLELDGSFAKIQIKDSGIGISQEDLPRIFDRFFRVDKARSREMCGSGLGLSIVQWIVKAHQGRIEVASKPGEGSCFMIWLPVKNG
jgi:heavy metal sensor kinase